MYMLFDQFDRKVAGWMERYGHFLLRISLAIIFIWFGPLKPFGLSPAQILVERTVYWFPADTFVPILGWWEVAIGIGLLFRPLLRIAFIPALSTDARHGPAALHFARDLFYRHPLRSHT